MTTLLPSAPRYRLVLGLLLAAVLSVVLVLALGPRDGGKEAGIVVRVRVVDAEGRAIVGAQAQRRFAPAWRAVGADGHVRLDDVVLRAGEEPSADAIAAALDVRAASHALRRGEQPAVTAREDGTWDALFVLAPFGTLRLRIDGVRQPAVKAWVEKDPFLGRVEAIGGFEVARPGQPAVWRVYEGMETVRIRIQGPTGTALRVREIPAPGPGFVREIALEARSSAPIRGRIPVPDDWPVPRIEGYVRVFQLDDGGPEIELDPVVVRYDDAGRVGLFEVPYSDEGRYRLEPVLVFVTTPAAETRGGETITIEPAHLRPWIVAEAAPWPDNTAELEVRVEALGEGRTLFPVPHGPLDAEDAVYVVLPEAGHYRIALVLRGTKERPPREGTVEVEVGDSGPHRVRVPVTEPQWGAVLVRLEATAGREGATVSLLTPERRPVTVLPGLGDTARFEHVRAGPIVARVLWNDPEAAVGYLAGTLENGKTLEIGAAPLVGGRVELSGTGPGLVTDARPRRLAWEADGTPYGNVAGEMRFVRRRGTARWHTSGRLAAGSWRATLGRGGAAPTQRVAFEVRAGETTIVPFPVR